MSLLAWLILDAYFLVQEDKVSQLRVDAARLVKGQPVLEYTHTDTTTLPIQASGTGCAWTNVEDMLAAARALQVYLMQAEQLVLLHIITAFDLTAPLPDDTGALAVLSTLPGKVIVDVSASVGTL